MTTQTPTTIGYIRVCVCSNALCVCVCMYVCVCNVVCVCVCVLAYLLAYLLACFAVLCFAWLCLAWLCLAWLCLALLCFAWLCMAMQCKTHVADPPHDSNNMLTKPTFLDSVLGIHILSLGVRNFTWSGIPQSCARRVDASRRDDPPHDSNKMFTTPTLFDSILEIHIFPLRDSQMNLVRHPQHLRATRRRVASRRPARAAVLLCLAGRVAHAPPIRLGQQPPSAWDLGDGGGGMRGACNPHPPGT